MAYRERLGRPLVAGAGVLFALVAVAYVIGAELSWQSFSSGVAFGFPPAGITVAALLLTERRRWPVVIAAIAVAEVGVDLQHNLTLVGALVSATANVVEPVVGASLVRRWCGGVPDLTTRGDLARFLAGAVVAGPAAGALIGATAVWQTTGGWWPGLVLQWVAGDGIAVLVVGGPILLWARRRDLVSSRWPELVLLVAVTAGLSIAAFRFGEPSALLFFPVLAWAAFRLGDLGVVLAGTAFACVANYMTAAGYGEFTHLGLSSAMSLAVTQAYIAVIVLGAWVLAQEVAARMSAVRARDSARAQRELADARRSAAELGVVLADATTIGQVGEQVAGAVRGEVGAAYVVINVLAADGRRFEQLAGEGVAAQVAAMATQWTVDSDAPGPQAVRDRAAVYLPDREAAGPGFADARQVGEALGIRAAAVFPLLTETGALGYLGVWWKESHETSGVERAYLLAMAETASRALERARLREAERRERARIETLAELTRLLVGALTPQAIGQAVADRVRRAASGADGFSLGIVSQDRQRLEWITVTGGPGQGLDEPGGLRLDAPVLAAEVARTGRPLIIETAEEYQRRYPHIQARTGPPRGSSWLTWPLLTGTTTIGSLSLMWIRPQRFEQGQLAFITAVADLIAQALVRARVYADEHAIATVLQRAVMPQTVAAIPQLEIGTCYQQAGIPGAVGGDWYDAVALPPAGAYLAVGDVAGHGITAADDMTQLRGASRALALVGHQPSHLLKELARITPSMTTGQFATMAIATLDTTASQITYASAGHPPLLIRRAKTGTVEVLPPAGGPALGPFGESAYTQRQTRFRHGDILLMYTDGLIERRGEDLNEGIARAGKELQAWQPGTPLAAFCAELVASLATQPQLDDICALAVRRRA